MKYIKKSPAPTAFIQWIQLANENWHPTFNTLANPEKDLVRVSLFTEQHGLCCYCESELSVHNTKTSHIEHLYPQSCYPEKAFDYVNMLLSCSCPPEKESGIACHCGQCKKDYDPEQMITPLDPSCESHFSYTTDGLIHAIDTDAKALSSIKHLGLNAPLITRARRNIFDVLLAGDTLLTLDEMITLVSTKIALRSNNTYFPYWTVWKQLHNHYVMNTCR
jgi:uncharacterized protein (TIGR02646 family)